MKVSARELAGEWQYIEGHLTREMVLETIRSYNAHVIEYAEGFEWDPDMQVRTSHDYLHSFIRYLKNGDHVLVAGSGTGRDALELQSRQFNVFCVDGSIKMLDLAVKHGIRVPMWCQDMADVELPVGSIDAILAESVLQHVAKEKTPELLQRMLTWIRVDGVMYVRLRLGNGAVFMVDDVVGRRYFCSYTQEEIRGIIAGLENAELVEDLMLVKHKVEDRPGFASFVLRKTT
jgi:SAM-dependent methyltransferase